MPYLTAQSIDQQCGDKGSDKINNTNDDRAYAAVQSTACVNEDSLGL